MTIPQLIQRGWIPRRERGDKAKIGELNRRSLQRFMDLPWRYEARSVELRIVHRRWMRRNGYRLGRAR